MNVAKVIKLNLAILGGGFAGGVLRQVSGARTRPTFDVEGGPGLRGEVSDVTKCFIRAGSNKVLVVDDTERLQDIVTVMDLMAAGADGHANQKKE